jgi:hypothetical protein
MSPPSLRELGPTKTGMASNEALRKMVCQTKPVLIGLESPGKKEKD